MIHSNVVKPPVPVAPDRCRRQSSIETGASSGAARTPVLLRQRQYAAREGMPGRRHADRPVQQLHREQRRAAIDIDRVRTAARAPVERRWRPPAADRRPCAGGMVTGTGGGPSGPGGARKVRNQRATAASSIEMPASSISRLWVSGWRMSAMASANTTAKNKIPLSGTIAKAMPVVGLPDRRRTLHRVDRHQEAEDRHRGRQRHADHADARDAGRCWPDAASQLWNAKYSVQAKNSRPWKWTTGASRERSASPAAASRSARSRERRRPCRPAPCRSRSIALGLRDARARDGSRSMLSWMLSLESRDKVQAIYSPSFARVRSLRFSASRSTESAVDGRRCRCRKARLR